MPHVVLLGDSVFDNAAYVRGWVADAVEAFEARYRAMLALVLRRALPTTPCTIYDGNLGPRAIAHAVAPGVGR